MESPTTFFTQETTELQSHERDIDAFELTDEDLDKVTGTWWGHHHRFHHFGSSTAFAANSVAFAGGDTAFAANSVAFAGR